MNSTMAQSWNAPHRLPPLGLSNRFLDPATILDDGFLHNPPTSPARKDGPGAHSQR